MANLNWAKTETGYAADSYSLTRTPGKRWLVTHNGTPLADGKHFAKLADAKQVAEDHRAAVEREYCADPLTTSDTKDTANCAEPITETAATATTGCSDSPKTAPATDYPAVLTQPKFCRSVPRESLTNQFTRLYFYHDLGIVRRALRESA